MRSILLLLLIFVSVKAGSEIVKVRGRVTCLLTENGQKYIINVPNAKIQIMEDDTNDIISNPEDKIESTLTDEKGLFATEGWHYEKYADPMFYVEISFPCSGVQRCDDQTYRDFCKGKNPSELYKAATIRIPQRFRYKRGETAKIFPIDYRLGETNGRDVFRNKPEL